MSSNSSNSVLTNEAETQALLDFDVHFISQKSLESNAFFTQQRALVFCSEEKFVGFCRRLKKRVPLIYATNKYFLFAMYEGENGAMRCYITKHIYQVVQDLEIPLKEAVYTSKLGSISHPIKKLPDPEKILVFMPSKDEIEKRMIQGQHLLPYLMKNVKIEICGEEVKNVFVVSPLYHSVKFDDDGFIFSLETGNKVYYQQISRPYGDLVKCWTEPNKSLSQLD